MGREKSILEVGAGTGLATLIAARCGASSVLATDLKNQVVLDLLQRNMTRNASLADGKVSVMPLDFNDDLAQVTGLERVDLVRRVMSSMMTPSPTALSSS